MGGAGKLWHNCMAGRGTSGKLQRGDQRLAATPATGGTMAKGIRLIAYHPMSRTYVIELGTQHEDAGAAQFLSLTSKGFVVKQGFKNQDTNTTYSIDFIFGGKNLEYLGGLPHSGKVKSIAVEVDGDRAYDIKGLNKTIASFTNLWHQDTNPFVAFTKLLAGEDYVLGSDDDDPDVYAGKGDDRAYGRDGNDNVNGGKGKDLNDGGAGNDNLNDTKGKDRFQFSTDLDAATNVDTIRKLGKGDKIVLSPEIFAAVGEKVNKGEFVLGSAPQDGNDHIIFNPITQTGFYDPDGVGGVDPIPFFRITDGVVKHTVFVVGYKAPDIDV
jgi:Ca2+-binding RTX toxin-like protein